MGVYRRCDAALPRSAPQRFQERMNAIRFQGTTVMKIRSLASAAILTVMSIAMAHAAETSTPPGKMYKSEIPADERRAFFGELHLHTGQSFDAWTFGSKVTPDQAYKFGRGETVMVPASQVNAEQGLKEDHDVPAKRAWPLDFMAVTDHSEFMGVL